MRKEARHTQRWDRASGVPLDNLNLPSIYCVLLLLLLAKSLQSCPTVQPHRQQPIRLHHPWDSPGTQSCPTLCDPMNRSTPGLPVHHQLPEFTQTHPDTPGSPEGNTEGPGTASSAETERKPEVPASIRDEALFHCTKPSGVPSAS